MTQTVPKYLIIPVAEVTGNETRDYVMRFLDSEQRMAFAIMMLGLSFKNFRDWCDFTARRSIEALPEYDDGLWKWEYEQWLKFWYGNEVHCYLKTFHSTQVQLLQTYHLTDLYLFQHLNLHSERATSIVVQLGAEEKRMET